MLSMKVPEVACRVFLDQKCLFTAWCHIIKHFIFYIKMLLCIDAPEMQIFQTCCFTCRAVILIYRLPFVEVCNLVPNEHMSHISTSLLLIHLTELPNALVVGPRSSAIPHEPVVMCANRTGEHRHRSHLQSKSHQLFVLDNRPIKCL
jgi:hypothetical protein